MNVFGLFWTSLAMVMVLFAMIGAGDARGDDGMPPQPPPPGVASFMMDEPQKPDTPQGFAEVADHSRARRQAPMPVPMPPMSDKMPIPGK